MVRFMSKLSSQTLNIKTAIACFGSALFFAVPFANGETLTDPVNEALPMVGTDAHGHTYPGATVPFGMMQLSPDTPLQGRDGCSG